MISFLIKYSKSEGLQFVRVMKSTEEAVRQQMSWERNYKAQDKDDVVVIALDSTSLANLMETHANYFWVKF